MRDRVNEDVPTLTDALAGVTDALLGIKRLPRALPISHLTITEFFDTVVERGLTARQCSIFDKKLVYCFYGGVFYRTGSKPTNDPLKYPIAFLLRPTVLNVVDCLYPFDTGALASGRCKPWDSDLAPWEQRLSHRPMQHRGLEAARQVVALLYGNNQEYLSGQIPAPRVHNQATDDICRFLSADLTTQGIDHRLRCLECQFSSDIDLKESVIWVGFPKTMTNTFMRMCETWTDPPDYYEYKSTKVFRPNEIAMLLQDEARKIVDRYDLAGLA